MAEDKKSFLLYADLIHTIKKMPNDKAGELFKHILMYVNDLNPKTEDLIIELTFEPIKQQLKRDLKSWEEIRSKRSDAGKASAEKKKQVSTKSTSVESVEQTSTKPTVNDNVTVTVNDNVNVTLKRNLIELFFKDLENCSDLETIAINTKSDINWIKNKIYEFRPVAELEYKDFKDFLRHFKNYINKEIKAEKNGHTTFKQSGKGPYNPQTLNAMHNAIKNGTGKP